MKNSPVRGLLLAGAVCALATIGRAQTIELRATINAAQENPATTSPATGSAIMLYNVAANTFDLIVSISGMTNLATASHIHEAAVGSNGPVVTNLGADAVYTRNGATLTATFRDIKHLGTPLTLLRGGAYYNIHSAQFPGGEIRGQLIARPKRLYAVIDVPQEQAAQPQLNLAGLNDVGGAVMIYDPTTNRISLRTSVFNFNNTLNNSHFHEGAPGISGPVVHNLGNNANSAPPAIPSTYTTANGFIAGSFEGTYSGDPIRLLTGGAYLNYHSTTFAPGEARGQVYASDEIPGTRLANLSVRGFVGTGDQVLIQGITVNGPEPIRVLVSAKGPSLSTFGIAGPLANPRLQLYDAGRRLIATNDDVGPVAAGSELASIPGVPSNPVESALVVVLPPGNYTAVVSSATAATGIALLEVNDLRSVSSSVVPASLNDLVTLQRAGSPARATNAALAAKAALEFCTVPLATVAGARR